MGGASMLEGFWPDVSHFPRPVSQATASILEGRLAAEPSREWGLLLAGVDFATDDDGWVYVRDAVVERPDAEEIAFRAARAVETVTKKRWLVELDRWAKSTRRRVVTELLALQEEPLEAYDDARLADHVERAVATAGRLADLHMELHLTDMIPLGGLLHEGAQWGLAPREVIDLMTGASPASAPSAALEAARQAAGAAPDADVFELPEVEAFLRFEGWHLASEPDAAALTVRESHDLVRALVLSAPTPTAGVASEKDKVDELRTRVPREHRLRFDELYADARATFGLRDDNTSLTMMWPVGLVRRAYLAAAKRLVALEQPDDVFSARPNELARLLTGDTAPEPTVAILRARTARRRSAAAGDLPRPVGEYPQVDATMLNDAQRWLHAAYDAYGAHYGGAGDGDLTGIGIGERPVTGTAVVAVTPGDAAARIREGAVLVVRATAPAYDAVLPLVSGLIVETGGLLSHAAIAARELGLPALLGVKEATKKIADGSIVSVDPAAGRAAVVAAAPIRGRALR